MQQKLRCSDRARGSRYLPDRDGLLPLFIRDQDALSDLIAEGKLLDAGIYEDIEKQE